jgi:surface antigen
VRHIAKTTDSKKSAQRSLARQLALVLVTLPLTGCMGTAFDLAGSPKVDKSISTNTVATVNKGNGGSDEATVQNAVTSVDLDKLGHSPLPWANASTGSAGVVTAINEQKSGGVVCRAFSTTRHSFEGIARFEGRTCLAAPGNWQLLSFDREE